MQQMHGARYVWQLPEVDHATVCALSARYNFSIPLMHTLLARGFDTPEKIDAFLFTDAQHIAQPTQMCDASRAVDRIVQAIQQREKILIAGDYDVDGITSTAMMMCCLHPLGVPVNYFLPHRVHDGYGLSEAVIRKAADSGYRVVITVDNGITAHAAAILAGQRGIDLIITDHHRPHAELPAAYAIVNPVRVDCDYPFKDLAGVGVTFKVLSLLYERLGLSLPPKVYELLLLGTVADVVPLVGENRYWVRHALTRVNEQASYAFQVLKQNGGLAEKPLVSSLDIAFSLAPQLNALGRMNDPRRGVQFLIDARPDTVSDVGQVLFEFNEARKDVERGIVDELLWAIEQKQINIETERVIMAAHAHWPAGVIGLVASRMVSMYGKPTLLFHITEDGMAKGSGRSIPAFDLFEALQSQAPFLERFGGHACAAGLSIKVERLPQLKQALEQLVLERVSPADLVHKITLDAALPLSEVNDLFLRHLQYLEPFGHANEAPLFYVKGASLIEPPQLFKDQHVKCRVIAQGSVRNVIFFSRPELFGQFNRVRDGSFDLAVQVAENYWQGNKTIELRGVDVAFSASV